MASRGGRERTTGGRLWRALTVGDRPYVLILGLLIGLAAFMALGPLQVFTAAADRVDELRDERDTLDQDVEELEERRDRLDDPEEIERLARSELGLVRPGEIPFVVVPPESEGAEADGQANGEAEPDDDDQPWYRRLGRWVADRLEGDE